LTTKVMPISMFRKFGLSFLIVYTLVVSVLAQPDMQAVKKNIRQRLEENDLLSISIAYVYPDGHTRYYSDGYLTTGRNQKVNKNTIYEIGSITKTFTTLILARMVEQHK